jgi:hypothetical protein
MFPGIKNIELLHGRDMQWPFPTRMAYIERRQMTITLEFINTTLEFSLFTIEFTEVTS